MCQYLITLFTVPISGNEVKINSYHTEPKDEDLRYPYNYYRILPTSIPIDNIRLVPVCTKLIINDKEFNKASKPKKGYRYGYHRKTVNDFNTQISDLKISCENLASKEIEREVNDSNYSKIAETQINMYVCGELRVSDKYVQHKFEGKKCGKPILKTREIYNSNINWSNINRSNEKYPQQLLAGILTFCEKTQKVSEIAYYKNGHKIVVEKYDTTIMDNNNVFPYHYMSEAIIYDDRGEVKMHYESEVAEKNGKKIRQFKKMEIGTRVLNKIE